MMKTGTTFNKIMEEKDVASACQMRSKFFISDIPADIFWINLVAQNIGINTLFKNPSGEYKKETFEAISESIGGPILGHPILAKSIMMNYAKR